MSESMFITDKMKQVCAICFVAGGAFIAQQVGQQLNTAHRVLAEKREGVMIRVDNERRDSLAKMQVEIAVFKSRFALVERFIHDQG